MEQVKVSEIFLTYQGEGPFAGNRQLFVRFFGCNLSCIYCDTIQDNYKSFSREGLLGKILDFGEEYQELTLTGGEPLLFADFLSKFLPLFKKICHHDIYLETNGTLPGELEKIIEYVNVISMDYKLSSSCGNNSNYQKTHREFISLAVKKDVILKAVITETTSIDDIKEMASVIGSVKNNFSVVLQPVTPIERISMVAPDEEMLVYFKEYLKRETGKQIMVLGQMHHCLGIR